MKLIIKELFPVAHHLLQEGGVLTTDDNPDNECMMYQSGFNELIASAKAVKIGHEIDPDYMVGCMIAYNPIYASSCKPEDFIAMTEANHKRYWFMDVHASGFVPNYMYKYWERMGFEIDLSEEEKKVLKEGTVDYIGFSYYMSFVAKASEDNPHYNFYETDKRVPNPYLKATDWGWPIDPKGLRYSLCLIEERYNLPMMIVENGMGAYDKFEEDGMIHDDYRIGYLRSHIQAMKEAVEKMV